MRIIPAIDIIDGKCVRLSKGYNTKIIYNENPLEVAKEFEARNRIFAFSGFRRSSQAKL
jgi:phosphoribosylformimino-5-aminoimidazole carboxamide ribonucleotide (ProFAR) isomerase